MPFGAQTQAHTQTHTHTQTQKDMHTNLGIGCLELLCQTGSKPVFIVVMVIVVLLVTHSGKVARHPINCLWNTRRVHSAPRCRVSSRTRRAAVDAVVANAAQAERAGAVQRLEQLVFACRQHAKRSPSSGCRLRGLGQEIGGAQSRCLLRRPCLFACVLGGSSSSSRGGGGGGGCGRRHSWGKSRR